MRVRILYQESDSDGPMAKRIEGDLDGNATLEGFFKYAKKSLIYIADQALKEEQAKGFDMKPVVVVDGQKGRSIQQVTPLGNIQYVARTSLDRILVSVYQAILDRSPVQTGQFYNNNLVFYNGKIVADGMPEMKAWMAAMPDFKSGHVIRFVNIMPYARKLERYGISAGRQKGRMVKSRDKKKRSGPVIKAPNGTYFLTFRSVTRKYKFNSKISFEFVPGGSMSLPPPPPGMRRSYKKTGRPYLYPSIKIVINKDGLV